MSAPAQCQIPGLPDGVAAAFARDLVLVSRSTAFIDRIQSLNHVLDNCISWRWAGLITGRQMGEMLRVLRRLVEVDFGEISDLDFKSAAEVDRWEAEFFQDKIQH